MNKEEIRLRNHINQNLERMDYHLRVGLIHLRDEGSMHEFIPPVDKWFHELPAVDQIVTQEIKNWQSASR